MYPNRLKGSSRVTNIGTMMDLPSVADVCDSVAGRIVSARWLDIQKKKVEEIVKKTFIFRSRSHPPKSRRQKGNSQAFMMDPIAM